MYNPSWWRQNTESISKESSDFLFSCHYYCHPSMFPARLPWFLPTAISTSAPSLSYVLPLKQCCISLWGLIGQVDASIHHYVQNINIRRIEYLMLSDNREIQLELLVFLLRSRSCNLLRQSSQQKTNVLASGIFQKLGHKWLTHSPLLPKTKTRKLWPCGIYIVCFRGECQWN